MHGAAVGEVAGVLQRESRADKIDCKYWLMQRNTL
jgi:hypothetical protein